MSDTPQTPSNNHLDQTLRPSSWEEYVGQETVKENLRVLLTAAKGREEPAEHLLFYGPPGLGKTTLAHLIAHEMNAQIKVTSGPAVEKVGDLASILTNLNAHDVLFVDEIHRLTRAVEEVLYPAMESGVLDIIIGKGPSARTIQLELPPFTLVGATTQVASLSSPLRSRFSGGVYRLQFYTPLEIERILARSAGILNIETQDSGLAEIARRTRSTPRLANHYLKRCRDFAQVHDIKLDQVSVAKALDLLGVDALGLNESDRNILKIILERFGGGPVGLSTVAAATAEEPTTIEEVYEPFLLQLGLIERTPRGRVITSSGIDHLGTFNQ